MDQLDGDLSVQDGVLRLEDRSHPAFSDEADQMIPMVEYVAFAEH